MTDVWTEFTLPIGDWSKDGHNQSDDYEFEINKSKKEIIEAYHKTCKQLNMTFDTNDMRESSPIRLINEYEDDKLSIEVVKQFLDLGVDFSEFDDFDEDNKYRALYISGIEASYLFLEFVKINLPDMKYRIVKTSRNYLFGYWGDLNISVGYGCFQM